MKLFAKRFFVSIEAVRFVVAAYAVLGCYYGSCKASKNMVIAFVGGGTINIFCNSLLLT